MRVRVRVRVRVRASVTVRMGVRVRVRVPAHVLAEDALDVPLLPLGDLPVLGQLDEQRAHPLEERAHRTCPGAGTRSGLGSDVGSWWWWWCCWWWWWWWWLSWWWWWWWW